MSREIRIGAVRVRRQFSSVFVMLVIAMSLAGSSALAQSAPVPANPTEASIDNQAFAAAIAANAKGDVVALEKYASTAADGQHRNDALMWLVATYRDMRDAAQSMQWANALLRAEPTNALALAVVANADSRLTLTSPNAPGADEPLSQAKQALRGLDRLRKPEGMQDEAFANLKEDLARTLNGSVGYAYFQRHDYVTARSFLRTAAALAPNNAQYTYSLALADLEGRDGDQQEGFKMLARSVNLTQGTPSGTSLAQYAKERYEFAGGTDANWQQYLVVTRVTPAERATEVANAAGAGANNNAQPSASTATTTTNAPPSQSTATEASTNSPSLSPEVATNVPAPITGASAATNNASVMNGAPPPVNASATATNSNVVREPAVRADASVPNTTGEIPPLPEVASAAPEPNLPPRAPIKIYGPGKPVSLGILIETAMTSKESRANVVNALSDMVRGLREKDEAFLVSFSDQVVFEQDLTNNANALVETMDKIKPQTGTALFDAVAFASGHLKRVAANENRALLVISDGSNNTNQVSPLELSSELSMSAVKIFCIGLQADTAANQQRLTALANATGGRAFFVASGTDFRGATRQIAAGLGLPF